MISIKERTAWKANGFLFLFLSIALLIAGGVTQFSGGILKTLMGSEWEILKLPMMSALAGEKVTGIITMVVGVWISKGLVIVQPNEARILTLFGKYNGTVREDGFFWINPFASKKRISLRVRNFESSKLKVNDAHGNPIEIGAVVVWKVVNSAKAMFDVEDFEKFVSIQSETAIRALASQYPYDSHAEEKPSLRGVPEEVAEALVTELQTRLLLAGVEVVEARISHLAYAPEIAQVMLRRQQAQAVVAARQQMVEGAMGMVELTLQRLEQHGVVELDDERKAAMVNNLLVTLVSEGPTNPVINTGTLYS